jgi:hypothetical protein
MDLATEPRLSDPIHHLQSDVYRLAADTLRRTMPGPPPDSPELWDDRIHVALVEVAAMVPANAKEAFLAARSVAAGAHASDCLDQVRQCANDPKQVRLLYAQAASMGREERGFCGTLLRMQAARGKRDADDDTRERAALTEHRMIGRLMQGLESLPPLPPVAAPPAPAPEAEPAPDEVPPPRPLAWSDLTEEEQQRSLLWQEADRYALYNTVQVQQIRKLGGLPPDCGYEPPRPEVLDIIINGDTSTLRWADTYVAWVPPEGYVAGS